jgi:serine/threonine protein kinase
MSSLAGNVIDERYELLSQIGSGGMGAVYKAKQHPFDREVAIKMLPAELPDEPEARARFEREALAISALKHKNIVMFYGYGVYRGAPYMVMEYINGRSLQQWLSKNKPINPKVSMRIAQQMAEALSCAHANGLVHRDLKPSNVMIVGDEKSFTVKIIDFGLARLLPSFGVEVQKLTEAGSAIGSVMYMSPEQCMGQESDARSDIYSLGCILHHCLTGVPPFGGDHSVVVMQMHVMEALPRLEKLAPGIPPALQAIVDHAVEKDPNDRYQTADEFLKDIRALLADGDVAISTRIKGTGKSSPKLPPTMQPPAKRRKLPILIATTCFALACGVALVLNASKNSDNNTLHLSADNSMLLYRQAEEAMVRNDPATGRQLFKRIIAADKQSPLLSGDRRLQCYLSLSRMALEAKDYAAAREFALEGVRAASNESQTFAAKAFLLGTVYVSACDADNKSSLGTEFIGSAIESAQRQNIPTWGAWLCVLAQRLNMQNPNSPEARAILQINIPKIPKPKDKFVALVLYASLLSQNGQRDEAMNALHLSDELKAKADLGDTESLRWYANGLMVRGDYKKARKTLEFLAGRDDVGPLIWPPLAVCLAEDGEFDHARRLLDATVAYCARADVINTSIYRRTITSAGRSIVQRLRATHREKDAPPFEKYVAFQN